MDVTQAWYEAKLALDAAKKNEAELRKQVLQSQFEEANSSGPVSGTRKKDLGGGYTLKADFKLAYKLENKNRELENCLEAIANSFEEGNYIARNLVKWKPELSLTEYKKLPDDVKKVFDEVVTVTQASTSLSVIPPKEK